jgi:hypothetical protein
VGALTGDFDVVLQVSGATLDRMAATMHQNGFTNDASPSLPHIVYSRIEGSGALAGERGSFAAQTGTPHIVLIDGATDRFRVEIGFRARYRADPGSTPLADVIQGTIYATYRLDAVDPSCPGWADLAADYVWPRVIQSSVKFEGSAYTDLVDLIQVTPDDLDRVHRHIGGHLANLMATQFQPKPHRLKSQFRRLITRSTPTASAVAFPLAVRGAGPAKGGIASIQRLFLQGHDFAVGISAEFVVGMTAQMVEEIEGREVNTHFEHDAGFGGGTIIDYKFRITKVDKPKWLGAMPFGIPAGLIQIRAHGSGNATRIYQSGVDNVVNLGDLKMTTSIEQTLMLQFDKSKARLTVSAFGDPVVNINGPQLAHGIVSAQVKNDVANLVKAAQAELDKLAIADKRTALVEELTRIDQTAGAKFDGVSFNPNGIVLLGSISTQHRYVPHVEFSKPTGGDQFDAIESWIPGGRVDSFEWNWRFYSNPIQQPAGPGGTRSETNSFVLARSLRTGNHFGLTEGVTNPLPGLDGEGEVCLKIKGVHVHPTTGQWVPVESRMKCAQFGYQFRIPAEVGPYRKVCDPLRAALGEPAPEIGIMRVATNADTDATHNTLILYLDDEWDDDAVTALTTGIEGCGRHFAGLLALVMFRDGSLDSPRDGLPEKMNRLMEALVAPLLITEDINERWSSYLGFKADVGKPNWRLLTPGGVVAWSHDGTLDSGELAEALVKHLQPSNPAQAEILELGLDVGERLKIILTSGDDCPPIPLRHRGTPGVKVAFVDTRPASAVAMKELQARANLTEEPPCVAIVVDGASTTRAQWMKTELDIGIPIVADADGSLTRGAGIRFTPSVLILDSIGRLVTSHTGSTADFLQSAAD